MSQGINSYHVFWTAFDWLIKTRIRAFDWLIKTEIRDLHVRNSRTSTMASITVLTSAPSFFCHYSKECGFGSRIAPLLNLYRESAIALQ